jgi:hypothetical protein
LEDDIKMDLKEIGWKGVEYVHMSPDRDQWWDLVNMIMDFQGPLNDGNVLTM